MKDINFGELAERIRMELPHDYMLLHPRLCEENGENLMADLLKLIFDSANLRTCESGLELQLFGVLRLECSATSFVLIC